jgi:hypothetical protein
MRRLLPELLTELHASAASGPASTAACSGGSAYRCQPLSQQQAQPNPHTACPKRLLAWGLKSLSAPFNLHARRPFLRPPACLRRQAGLRF